MPKMTSALMTKPGSRTECTCAPASVAPRAAGSPVVCSTKREFRRADPRQPRRELTSRAAGCVALVIVRVVDDLPLRNQFSGHFGKLLHQHHGQSEVTDTQDTTRVLPRGSVNLGIVLFGQ